MSQHLPRQLSLLKQKLLLVGTYVEESMAKAISSLVNRDQALAAAVIDGDAEIDRLEVDVEEECLKTLALYQPVATDLRFVVAILKINQDLERMGDITKNIAKKAIFLANCPCSELISDLRAMAPQAQSMTKRALDAMVHRDVALALRVRHDDDQIDAQRRQFHQVILGRLKEEPEQAETWLTLDSVGKHMERIADAAVNIAEEVIYMVEGEIIRHRLET